MKTFRVKYCQRPHAHHTPRLVMVEAENVQDAQVLAQLHAELKHGAEVSIWGCQELAPAPTGRVLDGTVKPSDLAGHIRAIEAAWRRAGCYPDTPAERSSIELAIDNAMRAAGERS